MYSTFLRPRPAGVFLGPRQARPEGQNWPKDPNAQARAFTCRSIYFAFFRNADIAFSSLGSKVYEIILLFFRFLVANVPSFFQSLNTI